MKVTYLTHFLPSYRFNILDELVKEFDIEFTVFSEQIKKEGFDLNYDGNLSFKIIESKVNSLNIMGKHLYFQPDIIKSIWRKQYDVYIISALKSDFSVWIGLLIGKILHRKIIVWGHCRFNKNPIAHFFTKTMLTLSNAVLFYSQEEKAKWSENEKIYNKSFVAQNTISFRQTNILEKRSNDDKLNLQLKLDLPTGIFSGRLIGNKKLHILLDAISILNSHNPKFQVIIIGEGPLENDLIMQSERLGITSYVHFTGAIFDETILSQYYSVSDFAIIPGHAGLGINQAFANCRTVITDNDFEDHPPEINMIMQGKTGLFYQKLNSADLADKILQLLSNKEELKTMCLNALKLYENEYSPRKMTGAINDSIKYAYKN